MNLYEEITLAEGQVIIHEILDPPPTNPPVFIAFGPSKKAIREAWREKFGKDYSLRNSAVPTYYKQEYESVLKSPPVATLLEIYPGAAFAEIMHAMTLLAQEMLIFSSKAPSAYAFIDRLREWVNDPTNDDPFGTMK